MGFIKLFRSVEGSYLISIILGLGLAAFFRQACKGNNCIVFRPVDIEEIKGKTYQYGDKCYTFEEQAEPCGKRKTILKFAFS